MVNEFWFEAQNISCFKNGYKVVKDLNLKLKCFENVILIGPNGSGKSSLIDLINRNIYPVLGNDVVLKIFNKNLINLWELRKRISTVNSEIKNRINPNLKVFDLIVSGLYGKYCLISKKSDKDISIAEDLINKMNIANLSKKCFSYLSDGEKQITLIARALINNPEILILDEPIANLDYRSINFFHKNYIIIINNNRGAKYLINVFLIMFILLKISNFLISGGYFKITSSYTFKVLLFLIYFQG